MPFVTEKKDNLKSIKNPFYLQFRSSFIFIKWNKINCNNEILFIKIKACITTANYFEN